MKRYLLLIKTNVKISYIIIVINIIIWLAMELLGGSTNTIILLLFGALYKESVLMGQVWRLISCAFLHIGFIHLLINSYTLYQLGPFIENFFGKTKFIATYILCALSASILSLVFSTGVSAGASGALFGLTGLLLGNGWAKKRYTFDLPIDEMQLVPFVLYNLFFGFLVPGIDNWAHIGGLVCGILLGYIFDPSLSFDPSPIKKFAPKILGIFSILILAVSSIFWIFSIFVNLYY